MKKTLLALAAFATMASAGAESVTLFSGLVFYDGYQPVILDADREDGILRHSNSIYAFPLSDELLDRTGEELHLSALLGARCDNYDRIGSFNIAFVPKGEQTYKFEDVSRMEIARYITPFMNMRRLPNEVPYEYDLPGLELVFHDPEVRANYDLWLEMDLFGVPYAANQQISGCADRNDVFELATLLTWKDPQPETPIAGEDDVLVPIYVKIQELHGNKNLNNYNEVATDTLGTTTRTWRFDVPSDVTDSRIVLINSNHGAAKNGEEYVRRLHLVYFDKDLKMAYTPGGVSCEPYRQYNTQPNGIYGYTPTDDWAEWNNWCPGQAVPTRYVELGAVEAGSHEVMIRIPDAVFYGKDGDARPSLYFQGVKKGVLPSAGSSSARQLEALGLKWLREGDMVSWQSEADVESVTLHRLDGQAIYGSHSAQSVDLGRLGGQAGIVVLHFANGQTAFLKVI